MALAPEKITEKAIKPLLEHAHPFQTPVANVG